MYNSGKLLPLLLGGALFGLMLGNSSCRKDKTVDNGGEITFLFEHKVDGKPLVRDTMIYVNAASNPYEVDQLQYFISDITLWKQGEKQVLLADSAMHYVDLDIPSTLTWSPNQVFQAGSYDSLTFTFGLNKEKNVSNYFVDPPERDMFWPEVMGGGYHQMKMNGKWRTPTGEINPFNMHLGVGMMMDSLMNTIIIQNYFVVTLPLSNCSLHSSQSYRKFVIDMDINSWFETPNTWDWNVMGGMIMQNQDAMHKAAINGMDAFSVAFEAPGKTEK